MSSQSNTQAQDRQGDESSTGDRSITTDEKGELKMCIRVEDAMNGR